MITQMIIIIIPKHNISIATAISCPKDKKIKPSFRNYVAAYRNEMGSLPIVGLIVIVLTSG